MYDRILALILLFVATFVPTEMVGFMVRPEIQLLLGTVVVLYLVLKDAIAGLIAGLALLIVYFRVYADMMGVSFQEVIGLNSPSLQSLWSMTPFSSKEVPYITPENLLSAQNNVVDTSNYEAEMKGVRGVYGEDVYGAQGMDKTMPGYSAVLGEDVS
jgi:hypothetical protein